MCLSFPIFYGDPVNVERINRPLTQMRHKLIPLRDGSQGTSHPTLILADGG